MKTKFTIHHSLFTILLPALLPTAYFLLPSFSFAQQPQTNDVSNTQPLYSVNAKYTQGVGPGYWPTAGRGLTLNLSAGTSFCGNPPAAVFYAGGTLTMAASATNYVYLDPLASCAPTASTTPFSTGRVPIATVVTEASNIKTITDIRTWFLAGPCTISSTGAAQCSALGTNQNITLTPSGTGLVLIPQNQFQVGSIPPYAGLGGMISATDSSASDSFGAAVYAHATNSAGTNKVNVVGLDVEAYQDGGGNIQTLNPLYVTGYQNSGSGSFGSFWGIHIDSAGMASGTLQDDIGLKIEDQAAGVAHNYAILTGKGLVGFGDKVTALGLNTIRFADQFPGADIGAQLNAAISDCGSTGCHIFIPAGTYSYSTTWTVSAPNIEVEGAGPNATTLVYTGSGDAAVIKMNPYTNTPGVSIHDLTLDGTGSTGNGFHTGDLVGSHWHNLVVQNFTTTGKAGWWADNTNGWFEDNYVQLRGINNSITTRFTNSGGASQASFAYGFYDFSCNQGTGSLGQVCVSGENWTNVYSSPSFRVTSDTVSGQAPVIQLLGGTHPASWSGNTYFIKVESLNGGNPPWLSLANGTGLEGEFFVNAFNTTIQTAGTGNYDGEILNAGHEQYSGALGTGYYVGALTHLRNSTAGRLNGILCDAADSTSACGFFFNPLGANNSFRLASSWSGGAGCLNGVCGYPYWDFMDIVPGMSGTNGYPIFPNGFAINNPAQYYGSNNSTPACNSTNEFYFWSVPGTPDITEICMKDASSAYAWRPMPSLLPGGGTITGSNGSLALTAAGTNQNVTLTPSGTGYSILNGNVGINTTDASFVNLRVSDGYTKTDTGTRYVAFLSSNEQAGSFPFGLAIALTGAATNSGRVITLQGSDWGLDALPNIALQPQGGNVGIGTTAPAAKLDVNADRILVESSHTPASSGESCTAGMIAWDATYVYVCVAANTWKRSALSSF